MRALHPIYDGDQGPGFRAHLDLGSGFDASHAAVVAYIVDSAGATYGVRPCTIYGVRSDKNVDVLMKGKETDFDALGKDLFVTFRVHKAVTVTRTPATNLLANPSFDIGVGTVADSWAVGGTLDDMIYELRQDDPAPPLIFMSGKCQRSYAPIGGTTTAYLQQTPAGAVVAGDFFSCGVWYRAKVDSGGSVTGTEHYMTLLGGTDVLKTALPASDTDWTFIYAEKRAAEAAGASAFALVNLSAKGYEIRYDDAFLFKGQWSVYHTETYSLDVNRRPRPSKTNFLTANFIKGRGGFEVDSNADGIADGWGRSGTGNTYSMEIDPDHTNGPASKGAQKVVLGASASERLRLVYRGHFKAGETWRFQVAYKNSGALSGSPANGDFGIVAHTEEFDGAYEESSLLGANFSLSSVAAYANKFRTLTLTGDHSVLVLDINLKTAAGGTIWLDDALLWRTA